MSEDKTQKVVEIAAASKKPKPAPKKPTGSGGGHGGRKDEAQRFGVYKVKNGEFYQFKIEDGTNEKDWPLCDFTCKIVEEVTAEDGLNDANFLRIEGRRRDGLLLPLIDVPAKAFHSNQGNWIGDGRGTRAFIYPGQSKKDNLRACIQLHSTLAGDIPRRVVYRFIGWKRIDDKWHYLHGGGAISAGGPVEGVQVDLGPGHMSRYQLPAPLVGDHLKQAAADALLLLDVAPSRPQVGAALLAAVARAPLGEAHCTDFAIWLHGLTGSRKSAVAAISLAFFGEFTARNFPANWSDSVNDVEAKAHQAKDGVFVVDDFKPSVNRVEAEKQHAMAERLVRGTGNQSGRGRRTANMQAQAAPFNRSMMIVTAEDLPRGQSLLGRLLVLELGRADVNNSTLSRLQEAARAGRFAGLMAAYLQWLAPRLDRLKGEIPAAVEQFRNAAQRDGFASSHPRAGDIYGNLLAGTETFMEFLEDAGGVSSEQSNVLLGDMETNLQQAFKEQGAYQSEQDEVERFLNLLRAAFIAGDCHISNRLDQGPPKSRPFAWGWRDEGTDITGERKYNQQGDCCGWHVDGGSNQPAEVWLEPNTAFKIVQEFSRRQGDAFLLSAASLWRRMAERGLFLKVEADSKTGRVKTTVKRTVAGRSVRVLVLSAELVESG